MSWIDDLRDHTGMPVWPVEQARAGWTTHIGDWWFATRCPECDELLTAQRSTTRVLQDHLYAEHEIAAGLLPAAT